VILNRLSSSHNKQIIISLWKSHYLIADLTLLYDADFDLNLRYKSYTPLQLTSVNLLICLMTKGLFRLMNVVEEPSKLISVPQFISLNYDSDYCCRIIPAKQSDKQLAKQDDLSLKLMPKLAWQEFTA
jgi:hypothetical protein